jgi:hypothetical protein
VTLVSDDQFTHSILATQTRPPKDLQGLLQCQDREFIEGAYQLLLGRNPDSDGFQIWLTRLRGGERKLQILKEINSSDEARAKGVDLPGLHDALRRHELGSTPILGPLIRALFGLEGDSPSETRSRAAGHHVFIVSDAISRLSLQQTRLETQLPPLQQTLAGLTLRQRDIERQFPQLTQTLLELNHRQQVADTQQLPTLFKTLLELNHRVHMVDTQHLPTLIQRFLELNHRLDTLETQQLPTLAQAFSGLTGRQQNFETQQLPTLLQTLSELNHRQLASDNALDNLVRSVPVALRALTRDIIDVRAQQDKASTATDQRLLATSEEIIRTRELIERSVEPLRHQRDGALDAMRQRLDELQGQLEHVAASTLTEERLLETRAKIESAAPQFDRQITELRDQLHTASHDVRYLLGRVEFIRKELMFEMRYGASAPPEQAEQLRVESKILTPEKLDAARKTGIRLNLGCGHVALEGYLNVDRRSLPGVDIVSEVDDVPFTAGQLAEIFSAHLIEHFPQEQLRRTLLPYWRNLLRPGGLFRVVAPDAEGMMKAYFSGEYPFERLREVTFGGQDYNGDFHYNMLNARSLAELLLSAGFVDIRVIADNRENGGCKEFEIAARRPDGA